MNKIKSCLIFIIVFSACSIFSETILAGPKMSETFAYYYYKEGRLAEAINEYKTLLKKDPNNYKIHYNLGVLYAEIKKYPLAITEFKKAAGRKSPVRKDALYNLVIIYGKYLKDTGNAYRYYDEFKKLKTQN